MVSSIIFIAVFLVITLFVNFKNKMSWIFSGYFLGIGILLFASVMHISKFSMYYNLTSFDYHTYLWLNGIKLGPSAISRLFTVGSAIIMLVSLFFLFTLRNVKSYIKILFFIPVLIYVIINDPVVTYKAFLTINSFEKTQYGKIVEKIMELNSKFGICVFVFYMVIPLYALFAYCRKTRILLKIQNSLLSLIHLATIYAIIIFFYITGPFRNPLLQSSDLLYFPAETVSWNFYSITQPVIIFLLMLILFITVYYKPFANLSVLTERKLRRDSQALNETLSLIFHSYKNMLFAIERLSFQGNQLIEKNKTEDAKRNFNDIHSISENALDALTKNLDMLRKINSSSNTVDIKECIDAAIKIIRIPENVKLITEINTDVFTVKGDIKHITECFVNLFSNSIEALKIKNAKDPFVKIRIFSEDDLICVEILDNGCGICKKDISQIFNPFYSTKQSNENWGIGLNYTKKVLNIYAGSIYVRSKQGRYTWFQIVMPIYRRKRRFLF